MTKKELDVFLSSDQKEFSGLRNKLSTKICSIPFLTCTPLEKRGADSTNVLDSSLKAVKNSGIYVGIFGKEYSEATIREYKEAVRLKKRCLTYVKELKVRDEKLAQFINDELKNEFKYYEFKTDKKLVKQLNDDLRALIFDTLMIGLEQQAKNKAETLALMSKEQAAPSKGEKRDLFSEAKISFEHGNYLECLVLNSAAAETTLRNVLEMNGVPINSTKPLGEIIKIAEKLKLLSADDIHLLRRISVYRNEAVHLGKIPDQTTIRGVLDITQHLLGTIKDQSVKIKGREEPVSFGNLWTTPPILKFKVSQNLIDTFHFPQVGWEIFNDSLYQLRMRIEIHPILGGKDLHPLSDNDINGTNEYEAEPKSYVFANGCFTLPQECANSNQELILEIHTIVEDINEPQKGEYKVIPRRWKYIREENQWSYYPQKPRAKKN